ncbi:hypothetical protein L3Q72_12520 [Vibrio sp. JC009]|uniref:hypothetical protein n=1 Tax=Vibrio sp. JC009 TaxID=2912314 RepID=UPI0023AFBA8F|nr:hypothetical protein [Vibrio sp. JC009]WED21445.1 hypothetical protein L3Q72_12520 [Vibrio sp. JC009]
MITRVASIAFFGLLFMFMAWTGVVELLLLPFTDLDDRVQLLSYVEYIFLFAGFFYLGGIVVIIFHQLFNPLDSPEKYADKYHNAFMVLIWISVATGVLSVFPRIHLGYKVDQAGYVRCVKEYSTSRRTSYRIYAKSESLCKDYSWKQKD